jgi:hypothetical protein
MDWKEYEDLTKYIYQTLGKQSGVEIIGHGNACKVIGKSGVQHQVDVLTKHSDGLHSYKTAIECKYWDKTVNKDTVMKVSEIDNDAQLNKGVIVSKLGFTPDAIAFAKFQNVGLIELREMKDEDWEGRIKQIEINMNALLPEITGVEFIIDPSVQTNIKKGRVLVEFFEIKLPSGERVKFSEYVKKFQQEIYDKTENEPFQTIYSFEPNTAIVYKKTLEETPIKGLKFTGVLRIHRDKIQVTNDHVWLIMKLIFENKTYTISKDKEIRERID